MAKQPHIFVVEDDDSIRALLEVSLGLSHYTVTSFEGAPQALKAMETTLPDVVIMDIMMEGMDGITALRLMRANERLEHVPVMMLTAKDTELDKVVGLDAGADDYMTKPFSVLELCARVRVLLRRNAPAKEDKNGKLRSDDLVIDLATREVRMGEEWVELTLKEFELLRTLMQNAPGAVGREALLQQVWGYDFVGETRTLDMHVGTLRAKLKDDPSAPKYIKTLRSVGYRFIGIVETDT